MTVTATAPPPDREATRLADDARGLARLLVQGVAAATDLVEEVHAGILDLPTQLTGGQPARTTRGIPRFVYQSVRGAAGLVGSGIETLLANLPTPAVPSDASLRREALVAALNGVMGDHLAATGNPLALPARLRIAGASLDLDSRGWATAPVAPTPRVLVQVHGLCMNDLQWRRAGHDHGAHLAAELGFTPVHLHYNSGLPIADNGRALSGLMQHLVDTWPLPLERLAILGHSMGGLVARAALAAAREKQHSWPAKLGELVFLGTPHHGAPLERAGNALELALGLSRWTAAFARLGQVRSAGIQDLRHGAPAGEPPLPRHLRTYAIAGAARRSATTPIALLAPGDGLVPVASALGEHRDPGRSLRLPASRRLVVEGTGHLDLLASEAVAARLVEWIAR